MKSIQLDKGDAIRLSWIIVCDGAPYFEEENGESWTPIGQNDALTWPDFDGLFRRKDPDAVDRHIAFLASRGVNCIRMMMEYCQTENRYLEKPVGRFQANMIQFWDDLFALCEKHKIRILLTPFDTFWMARRWKFHPYNKLSGGPCSSKWQWLTSEPMLAAIKNRFDFFIERWGDSGVIFGWDLWNEISPLHAGKSIENVVKFIETMSLHIRQKEQTFYGKSHLQTVSVYAPILVQHDMEDLLFRHPMLDFATTHFYDRGTIDYPKNTLSPASVMGNMVKDALSKTKDGRPFFDSEHGPISYFSKNKRGLPEAFDDEYFLYMQWAHIASGACGGGMRWPYRHPHVLTHGMRDAQLNLSQFVKLIDWKDFRRKNLSNIIAIDMPDVHVFGCGDDCQAVIWLLSGKKKSSNDITLTVPGLTMGDYIVNFWDTKLGLLEWRLVKKDSVDLKISIAFPKGNLALAVVKVGQM